MRNNTNRLLKFLCVIVLLWCGGAAHAVPVTPMVAGSWEHSAALDANGNVYTWGSDNYGQLGLARPLVAAVPQTVPGMDFGQTPTGARVAGGQYHSIALAPDGTVWAWGKNESGQLGDGTTIDRPSPVQVSGLPGIIAIAAGGAAGNHSLALDSNGKVWAWGSNNYGQLGDNTLTNRSSPVQVQFSGLYQVVAIAAGSHHSLAVKSDGTVWAWGFNGGGQIGDGTTTDRKLPKQVSSLIGISSVAAGTWHSLALKSDGSAAYAWGSNSYGQLGDGTTSSHFTPMPVTGLSGVAALAAGDSHSLALTTGGSVLAFGGNWNGQLGDGTSTPRPSPVQVQGLTSGVTAISASLSSSFALKSEGSVWGWGYNGGQLGDNTFTNRSSPVQVKGVGGADYLTGVVALSGGRGHTLAIDSDGDILAWGSNSYGQLGDGIAMTYTVPEQVPSFSGIGSIAAGWHNTLAVKSSDGSVWYWGDRLNSAPSQVAGISGVKALAQGVNHTLALKDDGTVWAWGYNSAGQLGDNTTNYNNTPKAVPGLTGVVAVAANWESSMALMSDGTVWAWGFNRDGQVGNGTTTNRLTPVQVLTGAVSIASGTFFSLAVKSDGTVWAWGHNWQGQLGIGTYDHSYLPVPVPGLANMVSVAAGNGHALALHSNGSVWGWGSNWAGQLGNGTTSGNSNLPVQVQGLADAASLAAGLYHSLAIRSDGTVLSWGYNTTGQLGDGTLARHTTPALVVNTGNDAFLNLICIDLSILRIFAIFVQCVGSRTDGMPTVDQSDMRGLVTA